MAISLAGRHPIDRAYGLHARQLNHRIRSVRREMPGFLCKPSGLGTASITMAVTMRESSHAKAIRIHARRRVVVADGAV